MLQAGNIGANFAAAVSTYLLSSDDQADILSQTTIAVQQAANPALTVVENCLGMDITDRVISRTATTIIDSLPSEEMKMYITIGSVVLVVFGLGLLISLNCESINE